ncbi:MAG TPA: hypothetical protein VG148_08635 [Pyrinomonadaceae bacterium]|nr:hypothetical protein [Pyrinomonadaceae bacterium]
MQTRTVRAAATLLALLLLPAAGAAQGKDGKEAAPEGDPVLWRDPGDVGARDLLEGPAEAPRPDLSRVAYVRDETGGYSPKFRVRDGAGRVWVAKMGREAQPETAAARLVWAVGYAAETSYLVPCVRIEGAPARRVERCGGDGFANVRFEARPAEWRRLGTWGWARNPFEGTREFKGLVVMMGLLNNWDLKDDNNKIIYVPGAGGARGELRYVVADLGATFGKTGDFTSRSRNEPQSYVKTRFVERVEGDRVRFGYAGKNAALFGDVRVEHARWVGGLLARLTDAQISDAFRAANYSDADVRALAAAVRAKTNELVHLPGGAGVAGTRQP